MHKRRIGSPSSTEKERGSTLLEFALVVVLFFTFFFGIIDFARALFAYHFISNAAREGTRYAIVRGTSCTGPASFECNITPTQIQNYVTSITPSGINSSSVIVDSDPSFIWPGTGPGTGTNGGCNTSNNLNNNPGCFVQVKVQYGFNFIFPFMPSGTCTVGSGGQAVTANLCMSSTSEMVISQ
jgi:Flp pilus assembly protein TadG